MCRIQGQANPNSAKKDPGQAPFRPIGRIGITQSTALVTKLEYNQSRPQHLRIAALEKAVDRLTVTVQQMRKAFDDQQRLLEAANRAIAALRERNSTT